jgi:hypothetical protein
MPGEDIGVDISITGCIFRNNFAANMEIAEGRGCGGAIYFAASNDGGSGNVTIGSSTFVNNSALLGGGALWISLERGVECSAPFHCESFVNILGSTFVNNTVPGGGSGLAVHSELANGTVTVWNSSFVNHGDSAYAFFADQTDTLNVTNSNFTNNTGGALRLFQSDNSFVAGCVFEGNIASSYFVAGCGGAIQTDFIYISNSSFIRPINTSVGHNDISSNRVTFYCPGGTTGKAVTVLPSTPPGSNCPTIDAADLPPSKKVMHCNPSKYVCHRPGTAPGQCVETPTGGVSHKDCIEVCN